MTATTVVDAGVSVTPTWRSLDTTIAWVDTTGRVTAKNLTGFTRIEVTAEDKKDTALVLVVPVPVVSVVVTPDTATREPGQTVQLTATPKDSIGGTLTGRTVEWTSSDASKATVSSGGLVTGVALGTVTITATIEGKTASAAVKIQESPGIRARLRGPAGTGFFFVRLTGTNNSIDTWHRLVAQNDTATMTVAQDPGSNFVVRVYAVDARTNNLQQGGGWVRVVGVWKRASLSVEPNARTEISVTVPSVTVSAVQAPDSVSAFSSVPVAWQVADSTGMIREMANHHLSYGDQPFGDGTIGPGRRDATQVVNGQGVVTFSASIPAQEVDGVRYWRMVHWQEVGGTVGPLILSLPFPSVTNGEPLRLLQVKPLPQGVRLSLRGPVGTGSFFVNVLGSGLPQGGVWRRINNVSGDTATLQQMLPVGSNYQVRLFAVDAQTDPERTGGGWVALTAVGRIAAATVIGNAFTQATMAAQPVALTNIVVPDSATVGSPVPLSWEINDTTGIIHSFANKHIGYDEASWGDGQIGPGRVDATATLIAADRYRYSASVPAQQSPKLLAWKISVFEEVGALFGVNRLSIVAPSITWRAEAPRYVKVLMPVSSVTVSPEQATLVTIGETQQLTAEPRDASGNVLVGRVVTWSSSNTSVATVSAAGLVTAVASGQATITASSEGKSGTAVITVSGLSSSQLISASQEFRTWTVSVPTGTTRLVVRLSGGTGNADLYVRRGNAVSRTLYDCRSWDFGNSEICSFDTPAAGEWTIGVSGTYSGVTLAVNPP